MALFLLFRWKNHLALWAKTSFFGTRKPALPRENKKKRCHVRTCMGTARGTAVGSPFNANASTAGPPPPPTFRPRSRAAFFTFFSCVSVFNFKSKAKQNKKPERGRRKGGRNRGRHVLADFRCSRSRSRNHGEVLGFRPGSKARRTNRKQNTKYKQGERPQTALKSKLVRCRCPRTSNTYFYCMFTQQESYAYLKKNKKNRQGICRQ